jgi:CRISP-associated protein Cas1
MYHADAAETPARRRVFGGISANVNPSSVPQIGHALYPWRMRSLYITEYGASLRHHQRQLRVEKDGVTIGSAPLDQVDAVIMIGGASISTPTLKLLLGKGIDTVLLSASGAYCGRLTGAWSTSGDLRRAQYAASLDATRALTIARACVDGKLRNMRVLLMRYQRERPDPRIAQAIERIARAIEQTPAEIDPNTLLGVEGAASAAYFGALPALLTTDWGFSKRVRRPPTDPVNVVLSVCYTLLLREVESAVQTVELDPAIGFLHVPVAGRPALPLDLMEEFRPVIADSVALRLLNSGLLGAADFTRNDEDARRPLVLTQPGWKRVIGEFEARMALEFQHPDTQERVNYRRVLELQARRIARAVRGVDAYAPFLIR